MQHLWLGPHYLGLADVLKGLNIVKDAENISISISISISIKNAMGKQWVINPKLKVMEFNGFPKLPALANNDAIHNLRIKELYWFQDIPNKSSLYIQ